MDGYSDALGNLVDQLAKLPGIGRKSAQRLAFHILKQPEKEAQLLAEAILTAKAKKFVNLPDNEIITKTININETTLYIGHHAHGHRHT